MAISRTVQIIGSGLVGTSLGLALREHHVEVWLSDVNAENVRTAVSLGAGIATPDGGQPDLTVVAVPPDHLAQVLAGALSTGAVVTDVGSVKTAPLEALKGLVDAEALTRYVGSHPMAGSERSGPLAASALLFEGRPWAITAHETSSAEAVAAVKHLVGLTGATAFMFTPTEHDEAVARTSHLPHVMAALVAGRLVSAPEDHLALTGQGIRDVTRIAGGDPHLWRQILNSNREALGGLLSEVRDALDELIKALAEGGSRLSDILEAGVRGTSVLPGKHGGPLVDMAPIYVALPDHPGELARLFAEIGEIGVNVEDVRIDHDPGRAVGLVEVDVAAARVDGLLDALEARGWSAHG